MDKHLKDLEAILYKHDYRAIKMFGDVVLNGAKAAWPDAYEKKSTVRFEDYAKRKAQQQAGASISHIKGTTQKQVHSYVRDITDEAIEEGYTMTEVADKLTTKFTELSPGRARTIARTEITMATQAGSLEAAKELQIPDLEKEWVSAQDDRVRGLSPKDDADHAVMNGQQEPLDAKFVVPPDADMDGPGDSAGGASQVCNCRCVLVYKRANQEG